MKVRSTFQRPKAAWLPVPEWLIRAYLVVAALAVALLVWQIVVAVWPAR